VPMPYVFLIAAIAAGLVRADGVVLRMPSEELAADVVLSVAAPHPWVSRGGVKLAAALDHFGFDPNDRVCLDVGASTGGFTDCLLQRGAARVYAVDVGYGQLAWTLRNDPRVVVMERTNFRFFSPERLPERPTLATADVSFISLRLLLPNLAHCLAEGADAVVLVKPQFEVGRGQVGSGGVVRDPQVHAAVLGRVAAWAVERGFRVRGLTASPLLGPAGNREFFLLLRAPGERPARARR
ncbi:MAG: TlyA family RNA methyltransferase, partial [Dehalococcoidia bacterium]|nr:TlyA family RNA methyltransferase [Dehalococcoidia bacterium]